MPKCSLVRINWFLNVKIFDPKKNITKLWCSSATGNLVLLRLRPLLALETRRINIFEDIGTHVAFISRVLARRLTNLLWLTSLVNLLEDSLLRRSVCAWSPRHAVRRAPTRGLTVPSITLESNFISSFYDFVLFTTYLSISFFSKLAESQLGFSSSFDAFFMIKKSQL